MQNVESIISEQPEFPKEKMTSDVEERLMINNFALHEQTLKALIMAGNSKGSEKRRLDESRVSSEIDEHFLCGICYQFVEEAVECRECNHLFCAGCFKQW